MSPSTKAPAKKPASKKPASKPADNKPAKPADNKPTKPTNDKPVKPGDDKPGDGKEKTCKPFSVSVQVDTNDSEREITFGLTHGCNNDNTDFWTIDFSLKVKKGNKVKTHVEVHVVIGKDQAAEKAKADALAADLKKNKKLDDERTDLLQTEVADRALQIPPEEAQHDPVIRSKMIEVL
jgi:hypothetical protein